MSNLNVFVIVIVYLGYHHLNDEMIKDEYDVYVIQIENVDLVLFLMMNIHKFDYQQNVIDFLRVFLNEIFYHVF
jgi:hypothetical protein